MRYSLLKCTANVRGPDSLKPQVLYAIPLTEKEAYRLVLKWHETEEPEKWVDLPQDLFDQRRGDRGRPELLLKKALEPARLRAGTGRAGDLAQCA